MIGSRGEEGEGWGGRFPLAFVVLDFLKRPRLNWTYWPTNRGAVPTESRERDNTDPRLRGGEGGDKGERRGGDRGTQKGRRRGCKRGMEEREERAGGKERERERGYRPSTERETGGETGGREDTRSEEKG